MYNYHLIYHFQNKADENKSKVKGKRPNIDGPPAQKKKNGKGDNKQQQQQPQSQATSPSST